jgi:hypothetical protein
MDPTLVELTSGSSHEPLKPGEAIATKISFLDDAGTVQIHTPDGPKDYALKPVAELFGTGPGALSIDPTNDQYAVLFLSIEQEILRQHRADPSLTDARVLLALEQLAMNPEAAAANDPLIQHLQLALRVLLSLKDYSRQDVRGALRKIAKSVARHARLAGPRGYLSFIREHVPG